MSREVVMITHDTKATSAPKGLASLLLANSSEEGDNGFAKLLESLQNRGDEKSKDSLLLVKNEGKSGVKEHQSELLSLLHGDETQAQMKTDIALLDPQLTKTLPTKELVQLVQNAKAFLKEQIVKISDTKEVPKTLKGLLELAKKVGIDVAQIKIESVVSKQTPPSSQTLTKTQDNAPTQQTHEQQAQQTLEIKPSKKANKTVPQARVEHSTAEIVQTKQKTETRPQEIQKKEKSNPLRALLQISNSEGERVVSEQGASTKVPKQALFNTSLTQLLQGNNSEITTQNTSESEALTPHETKTTPLTVSTQQTDTLTQKVAEAKQMVQHFASQLKEEVENYKPPFTRLKMKLNPVKLGEVDITMVQRGNSVHINVSSNSAALNILMQNSSDLKTQLSNNGITNASMTFNSSADQNQQHQQHNQQNRQQELVEMYENFENSDDFELLSSLDIVIPRYI